MTLDLVQKARARWRAYYAANRARRLLAKAKYEANHRAAVAAKRRRHYAANAVAERARSAAYKAAHPELHAQHVNQRRARLVRAGGSHTLAEWREKCALFANLCAYCGEAKPLERDHKVPLLRGGSDDISNIVPSCRSCNSRKGVQTAAAFVAVAA